MKKPNLFFRFGTYALLVAAGLHLVGHFSRREPANEVERTLLDLLTTYEMNVGGVFRTMEDVLSGFSLSFSVFLVYAAALNLAFMRIQSDDRRLLQAATVLNILFSGILLVISLSSFPLPPTVLFAVIFLLFLVSLALDRTRQVEVS
jgi:hypothetical protein